MIRPSETAMVRVSGVALVVLTAWAWLSATVAR